MRFPATESLRATVPKLALLIGALCLFAMPARADVTLSWGPGSITNEDPTRPVGSVTWHVNQNTLLISVVNNSSYAVDKLFFNTSGFGLTGLTVVSSSTGNISKINLSGSPTSQAQQASAFGKFNWEINWNAAAVAAVGANFTVGLQIAGNVRDPIGLLNSIVTTQSTGGALGSAQSVIHWFKGSNPDSLFSSNSHMPEGSSLLMLCAGLLPLAGVVAFCRRRPTR